MQDRMMLKINLMKNMVWKREVFDVSSLTFPSSVWRLAAW